MSRLHLNWFNLTQKEGQDLCLKIPICNVYSVIIDRAIPGINHVGWRHNDDGTCYTFIKGITEDEQEQLNNLLVVLQKVLCLTRTKHLEPHFTNELTETYALDFNFHHNVEPLTYTPAGNLEHHAKEYQNAVAARELARVMTNLIRHHPTLARVDAITAVPPRPSRSFHLPNQLVALIGESLGRQVGLSLAKQEVPALRTLPLPEKIAALANAFTLNESVEGSTVLLIDDLFQSGATLWSLARFLKARGAREVYGLACVKSLRDTDNV